MVRGRLIVGRVTGVAGGRNRAECAARMTPRASQSGVPRRQRERCMLTCSRQPGRRAVALLAGVRKRLSRMVGSALIIRRMTGVAGGRNRAECARVTLRAAQTAMSRREGERRVAIGARQPRRGRVALFTTVREGQRGMVRGRLIVGRVTGVAGGRNRTEGAARMTPRASKPGVPRRQGERCMLTCSRQPRGGAVALLTGVRKRLSRMVGSALIIRRMTGVAGGRNRTECAARMTPRAGQSGVPRRQRERRMLIGGRQPRGRAVALLTGVRECLGRMVGGPLIVRRMAGVAGRGERTKRAACMTLGTIQTAMSSREWERGMVIGGRQPGRRAMALVTGLRKRLSRMVGGPLEVHRVARRAVGWNGPECATGMALRAGKARVSADEGEGVVRHLGRLPRDGAMATVAVGGPSARRVVGRGRARQVRPVAQVTRGRGAAELAGGRARMAAFTGRRDVGPQQREPSPCMCDNRAGRPPARLLVAPPAVQPQAGRVRIGMAPAAASIHVDLHGPPVIVAAQAGRLGVRSLQRVAGLLLMIEREIVAQDVPAVRHVADPAIGGETVVGHERSPFLVPAVARPLGPAIDQDHRQGHGEQENVGSLQSAIST